MSQDEAVTLPVVDFTPSESHNYLFAKLRNTISNVNPQVEKWLHSLLVDINGDLDRFITDKSHPNHALLRSYPTAKNYLERSERYVFHRSHNQIYHKQYGAQFDGSNYSDPPQLQAPIQLFNPTGFTLLLRVYCEKKSRTVVMFGLGYRWFGLNPSYFSFNNGRQTLKINNELLKNDWNDIWISYNNAQDPGTYNEPCAVFTHKNTNPEREILCIVNGVEQRLNVTCDIDVLAQADTSLIEEEAIMQFYDFSCGNPFIGYISSLVWFNQSCASMNELRFLASTFLKNHTNPSLEYGDALQTMFSQ